MLLSHALKTKREKITNTNSTDGRRFIFFVHRVMQLEQLKAYEETHSLFNDSMTEALRGQVLV